MHIKHVSLTNFRNYGRLELDLSLGPTLLHGANAQGKTNLLEALYYIATTRSPFADADTQLLTWEATQRPDPVAVGRIVVHAQTARGTKRLELRLIRERQGNSKTFRREALVDRRKVRLMDLLGELRVVLFLPEDVGLISGPPSDRRRYMNITLCQCDRLYCQTLSRYNKLLEQRNALLRQLAERGVTSAKGTQTLDVYTTQLVEAGATLFARRAAFIDAIGKGVQRRHYEDLTAGRETLRLRYAPRIVGSRQGKSRPAESTLHEAADWLTAHSADLPAIADRFTDALNAAVPHDLARGTTSIGPHRDDWAFVLDGRSLSRYGSRGQQRTAVLALKLAETDWVSAETDESPLLLLDDIMAELDGERRQLLLEFLPSIHQSLITTTDPTLFSDEFRTKAHVLTIERGRIQSQ